jgi:hypothetical protein
VQESFQKVVIGIFRSQAVLGDSLDEYTKDRYRSSVKSTELSSHFATPSSPDEVKGSLPPLRTPTSRLLTVAVESSRNEVGAVFTAGKPDFNRRQEHNGIGHGRH